VKCEVWTKEPWLKPEKDTTLYECIFL